MGIGTSKYRKPEPALVEQREAVRHAVFVDRATVRRHRSQPVEARLQDLSIYGCKLECRAIRKAEERIWLRFQGGMPIAATVIWSKDGQIGCRFDSPISSGMVRAMTLGA